MKSTAIRRTKKSFAEGSRHKKLFAKIATKKLFALTKCPSLPSKKIMVRPLYIEDITAQRREDMTFIFEW
jgi:hypothetical protein